MLTNLLFGGTPHRHGDGLQGVSPRRHPVGSASRAVGFDFEPEVTARLLLAGQRIVEVPIGYEPRTADEGKKIGWVDGIDAIYMLLKCRFAGRDPTLHAVTG